ncbi:hypothetical protein FF36_00737 [Frankia torreyi]|uniref:Uncharacterized protein n=1 Tax=Frankia torreyi TaxID=1856 RepID=A0A0D8BL97_9ACTN|nr:hypothetical protein FF36_00737 [Frankia torreyi]KQM07097.1 hypothetical protein FF86_1005188 [Frankia sp. CpI1-P]
MTAHSLRRVACARLDAVWVGDPLSRDSPRLGAERRCGGVRVHAEVRVHAAVRVRAR